MRTNKSQAILIFTLLILFVAAALIVMAPYLKRRIQGSYKHAADIYGVGISQSYQGLGGNAAEVGPGPGQSNQDQTRGKNQD